MASYFDDNRDSEEVDNEDMMNSIEFEQEASDSDELMERDDSEEFEDEDN